MKKILGYFRGEKIITFIAFMAISTVLNVIEPHLTSQLVDALTEQKFTTMFDLAIRIAIVAISLAFLKYRSSITAVKLKNSVAKKLEADLCNKALNIKGRYLSEFKSGELTSITKENPNEMLRDIGDVNVKSFCRILTKKYVGF